MGFRGKNGQKVHPNFATNIAMECLCHTFCAPDQLRQELKALGHRIHLELLEIICREFLERRKGVVLIRGSFSKMYLVGSVVFVVCSKYWYLYSCKGWLFSKFPLMVLMICKTLTTTTTTTNHPLPKQALASTPKLPSQSIGQKLKGSFYWGWFSQSGSSHWCPGGAV